MIDLTRDFPAAERFARRMSIPTRTCPVTRELYGYAQPNFDRAAAKRVFDRFGLRADVVDALVAIVEARFDARVAAL